MHFGMLKIHSHHEKKQEKWEDFPQMNVRLIIVSISFELYPMCYWNMEHSTETFRGDPQPSIWSTVEAKDYLYHTYIFLPAIQSTHHLHRQKLTEGVTQLHDDITRILFIFPLFIFAVRFPATVIPVYQGSYRPWHYSQNTAFHPKV